MVKVEYEDKFLYNDDELAAYVKAEEPSNNKKKQDKNEKEQEQSEEKTKTLDHIEFYEAREIEKIIDRIEKLGVDIEDYDIEEEAEIAGVPKKESKKEAKKPKYSINIEKKTEGFLTLKEILKFVMGVGKEGMAIQRYKGLGEMNPEQLWETTMDPEKRTLLKVMLEDAVAADEMFTVLMGEAVEPRREFIEKHAHEVKVLDI